MKKYGIIFVVAFLVGLFLFLLLDNTMIPGSRESDELQDIEKDTEELQKKIDESSGIIIDVRTQEEYDAGHLQRADLHFDLRNGDFEDHLASLDKSRTYYLYCRTGNRSGQAVAIMKQNGFSKAYNIGGIDELREAGFQIE